MDWHMVSFDAGRTWTRAHRLGADRRPICGSRVFRRRFGQAAMDPWPLAPAAVPTFTGGHAVIVAIAPPASPRCGHCARR